jgi:hypothetical protein
MIHLLTAYQLEPEATGLFWAGSFAPDYTNDREKKDTIHLRLIPNRFDALAKMYDPGANDFERGWFLHLFTDACWDEAQLPAYIEWFTTANFGGNWFSHYREEIGAVSYGLYHSRPWAKGVWELIRDADLTAVKTTLPVTPEENGWYRDRVARKHAESDPAQTPRFYTEEMVTVFAEETAKWYRKWAAEF